MVYRFLLIGNPDYHWRKIMQDAIASLGELEVCNEDECVALVQRKNYDVVIVDATAVEEAGPLVSRLCGQVRQSPVIVVTASPTWRRAREVFQAGAWDYVHKSHDKNELFAIFSSILARPLAH